MGRRQQHQQRRRLHARQNDQSSTSAAAGERAHGRPYMEHDTYRPSLIQKLPLLTRLRRRLSLLHRFIQPAPRRQPRQHRQRSRRPRPLTRRLLRALLPRTHRPRLP